MQVKDDKELSKKYNDYVKKVTKTTSLPKNMFHAFLTGGIICTIGQIIMNILSDYGVEKEHANSVTILILIAASAYLTGMNIYAKIG